MEELVIYHQEDSVGALKINRPRKRNAISTQMQDDIIRYLRGAQNDPSVKAVTISSAGSDFCSGADIGDFPDLESLDVSDCLKISQQCAELYSLKREAKKPIVVSAQGKCLGVGLLICMMATIVVASDDAVFGLPEINLGFAPLGVFPYVADAVGVRKAMELAITGRRIDASTALEWGIAHYKVSGEELNSFTCELTRNIANKDGLAMQLLLMAATQLEEQAIRFSEKYGASLLSLSYQAQKEKHGKSPENAEKE